MYNRSTTEVQVPRCAIIRLVLIIFYLKKYPLDFFKAIKAIALCQIGISTLINRHTSLRTDFGFLHFRLFVLSQERVT